MANIDLGEKFKAFKQLVELCESRGYDPEGASLEYNNKEYPKDYKGRDIKDLKSRPRFWCLMWYQHIDDDEDPVEPCYDFDHPAVLFLSGREEWRYAFEFIREDGPSIVKANGQQIWCRDNKVIDPPQVNIKSASKNG